jgi:hypothetical protein
MPVVIVTIPIVVIVTIPVVVIGEDDAFLHLTDRLIRQFESPLPMASLVRMSFSQLLASLLQMPERRVHARLRIGRSEIEMPTTHGDAEQSDRSERTDFPTVDHRTS